MHAEQLRQIAEEALAQIKARDVVVLDTSKLTSLFDFMIIATAESTRQTKALARNVAESVKAAGGNVLGVEGEQTGEWVLVDMGSVIVHIMQPAIRDYYNLEQLWGGERQRRIQTARRPADVQPNEPGGAFRS
jgi:ribosome-associated protein